MDMMNRSSIKAGPAYGNNSTQQATQKTQLRDAVNQVSDHAGVQGHQAQKVEGSGAVRHVSLRGYRAIFEGVRLPAIPAPAVVQGNQSSLEAFQAVTGQTPVNNHSQADQTAYTKHGNTDYAKGNEGSHEGSKASQESGKVKGSDSESKNKRVAGGPEKKSVSGEILSKEDQVEVTKLETRDREVRTHEQAHVSAGGQHIKGGIKYDYQKGPDGRNYAVGGHVNIDVSEESSPEATIGKMQQVKRAALAPAEPSSADRSVAAEAAKKEQKARQELAQERQDEVNGEEKKDRVSIGGSRRKEAQAFEKENSKSVDSQGGKSVEGGQEKQRPQNIQGRSRLIRSSNEAKQSRQSQIQSMPEPPRVRSNMSLSAQSKIKNLSFWR